MNKKLRPLRILDVVLVVPALIWAYDWYMDGYDQFLVEHWRRG